MARVRPPIERHDRSKEAAMGARPIDAEGSGPPERALRVERGEVMCPRRGPVDIERCWVCREYRGHGRCARRMARLRPDGRRGRVGVLGRSTADGSPMAPETTMRDPATTARSALIARYLPDLSPRERHTLALIARDERPTVGTYLMREGRPTLDLGVIVEGRLAVRDRIGARRRDAHDPRSGRRLRLVGRPRRHLDRVDRRR